MKSVLAKRWKVYNNRLRPQFPGRIIEINCMDGETVIPWSGFDASDLPKKTQQAIAREIVRHHNAALKAGKQCSTL